MESIVWEFAASNANNAKNLAIIQQWWQQLKGKTITWQQRIQDNSSLTDLDWETQRFDEKFVIQTPELKGITVFWSKPDHPVRDITATRLELVPRQEALYLVPKSQSNVVIRVRIPQVKYDVIHVNVTDLLKVNQVLVLRDRTQLIEIRATLTPEQLKQL